LRRFLLSGELFNLERLDEQMREKNLIAWRDRVFHDAGWEI
jgi:hypothetical protein